MKKLYLCVVLMYCLFNASAQSWNIIGNSGLTNNNFLGTTDNKDLILKVNNIERGRLIKNGIWRFGTSTDYAMIDSGRLTFAGKGTYLVGNNKYVFQSNANPNYGLFYNAAVPQYEFRNGTAMPVFSINANNGNGIFKGTLKIGAYTLPATDGTNAQVLTTNGTGTVSWSTVSSTGKSANRTLSNLAVTTQVNVNLLPQTNDSTDIGSSAKGWKDLYIDGRVYVDGIPFINPDNNNSNVGVGKYALSSNTGGNWNTAIGDQALQSNTNGSNNVANGFNALYSNTEGSANTANGSYALFVNTTGSENTATGISSLAGNTTGYHNVAIGADALYANTTGADNCANGSYALFANTTGNDNTANGFLALYTNTTGVQNMANGAAVLFSNTIGNDNSANGFETLYYNTEGSNNVADGSFSLLGNTTGNNITAIGFAADVNSNALNNATAIGASTVVDASNKVRIGNTDVTSIGGQVGWTSFSDGRYKRNIKEDVKGLEFVNALRPVTYTLDLKAVDAYYNRNRKTRGDSAYQKMKAGIADAEAEGSRIIHTGFVAQEVEAAAKKMQYDFDGVDKPKTEDGVYGLRYSEFVVPLVKAVQELSKANNDKDAKIDSLQKQFADLKKLVLQMQQTQQQCSPCSAAINSASTQQNASQYLMLTNAASLEQNIPNPFTNSTTIGYYLPQSRSGGTSAKIIITDRNGKALKQLNITAPGKGSIHVDASTLTSGAYNYTLYVDGKQIASKQMMLTK